MKSQGRNLFFVIFTASGFAGLIYESIWTHYLKLFLGHAAYAQTLVLAVFMGGMALGSWLCAHYSRRWNNILLGYAVAEAAVGVFAVFFHPVYVSFLDWAYTSVIPGMGSPAAVTLFKWAAASLLILPQSILLGMTFPLMTAGVIRRFPANPGATIAMLYFTNSIGAAVGVLASGFLFIAWAGLPGTLVIAGVINIAVAAVVWLKVREDVSFLDQHQEAANRSRANNSFTYWLLLAVALLTGASSFIYEIGWIRMLSLVLSSSTHAFELMLSAFITGIALGGLWIRRRIDGLQHPIRFLAFVQIAMGALALATLPLYANAFEVMAWLVKTLNKTDAGYLLFNLSSHGIALAVMLPATFCAGMTLPLITAVLFREGYGEKSIGMVYAFNTIGCIVGIFFSVHLAMPLLGLKGMLGLGAGIDIVLGLALVWWVVPSLRLRMAATAAGAAMLMIAMMGVKIEPHKMASGVYRSGYLLEPSTDEVVYHHDGKTCTVSMTKSKNKLSIRTNGKVDAAIGLPGRVATADELTQVVVGALPLFLHPHARTAANIGWGSGMTTNTLLSTQQLERVDSIEIEPAMIEAAMLFRPRVDLAYTDPRSRIYIADAKTFFSTYNRKYDIIVSEPSNPWVSGVAGLFSEEFYRRMKGHLNNDGLLVQWLQLYEIDLPLVASVFEALSSEFADYIVYAADLRNIFIIARSAGPVPELDPSVLNAVGLSQELKRVGIAGIQDVALRKIGRKRALGPLFKSFAVPANSDYFPLLSLYAPKTRFLRKSATDLTRPDSGLRIAVEMLEHDPTYRINSRVSLSKYEPAMRLHLANMLHGYIRQGRWEWPHPEIPLPNYVRQYADIARRVLSNCDQNVPSGEWWDGMFNGLAKDVVPYSTPEQLAVLWRKVESPTCWARLEIPQRDFVMLMKAIGKRDAPVMAKSARKLLEEVKSMSQPILEYILSAGLLGSLTTGNVQDAKSLWKQHSSRLDGGASHSLLIRLIVANMEDPT